MNCKNKKKFNYENTEQLTIDYIKEKIENLHCRKFKYLINLWNTYI